MSNQSNQQPKIKKNWDGSFIITAEYKKKMYDAAVVRTKEEAELIANSRPRYNKYQRMWLVSTDEAVNTTIHSVLTKFNTPKTEDYRSII